MATFTHKDWKDADPTTPLTAAAMEDLEDRIAAFAQTAASEAAAQGSGGYTSNIRINVRDYNAVGDGSANDTVPWQNALAAATTLAASGKACTVYGRAGDIYKVVANSSTPKLAITSGVTIDLGGSTIDMSTSGSLTNLMGSVGTVVSSGTGYQLLAADAVRGEYEIAVPAGTQTQFAEGDFVKIASEADMGSGTGKGGEIVQVAIPECTIDACDASQTTIYTGATATNPFPQDGGTLQIQSEKITYTGCGASGAFKTFTGCTRGAAGTTAASHAAGTTATFVPASGQVWLKWAITADHGYATADTAFVQKITMVEHVGLKNGRIRGGGTGLGHLAARFNYCTDVTVRDVRFDNVDGWNVTLANTHGALVEGCTMYKSRLANPAIDTNLGYGVCVTDATQDITVANCHMRHMRHCVTHGNATYGYPRRCFYIANHMMNSSGDTVEAHSPCDDVNYLGNYIMGGSDGILHRGSKITIIGNRIENTVGAGISLQQVSEWACKWKVEGNTIINSQNEVGIVLTSDTLDVDHADFISVVNNNIQCNTEGGIEAVAQAGGAVIRPNLMISGNMIDNVPSTFVGINLQKHAGGIISNNRISNVAPSGLGIRSITADKMIYSGNSVGYTSAGTGKGIDLQSVTNSTVLGNVIELAGTGILLDSASTGNLVENNHTSGCTTGHTIPVATITVAGATTLTLPREGSVFVISGTGDITSITASHPGRRVTLSFSGTKATSGLVAGSNLKISSTLAYTPNDTITLVSDGTNWIETGRSINPT